MSFSGKKIVITGHSKGIGAALFEILSRDHEVMGFSRTNGHDLADRGSYAQAWQEMKQADIVINNAYTAQNRYLQTELLNDFVDAHQQDDTKLIVNILSMGPYVYKTIPAFNRYASSKVLLSDTVNRLKTSGHRCGIICVAPGWVETQLYHQFKENNTGQLTDVPLSPIELSEKIVTLMKLFYEDKINVYMLELKKMR
jgi:short-subunit dehydrogenase